MDSLYKPQFDDSVIAIIGVGYVGLPLAMAFANDSRVIAFDVDAQKIAGYRHNAPALGAAVNGQIKFTSDPDDLDDAHVYIVTVPTPVDDQHKPELTFLESACQLVGSKLSRGDLVIYESTVYPGLTEEYCIPLLEAASGLVCGRDFQVGYSPERINPGDTRRQLENTVKIVAGCDEATLTRVTALYERIVEAGIYRAESIVIAEAAKVVENAQRDMNIAFMNEISMMFHHMGIDTKAVLDASATKWNFVRLTPGLVGGHCIGVDTYYLTHRAEEKGYYPTFIHAGRTINENMGRYIAQQAVRQLVRLKANMEQLKIAILGMSYKENSADMRNSKVLTIIEELSSYGITPIVIDPVADPVACADVYGLRLTELSSVTDVDAVIVAVPHDCFLNMTHTDFLRLYGRSNIKLLIDVKGRLDKQSLQQHAIHYWRL